jgi:hypothetical protein
MIAASRWAVEMKLRTTSPQFLVGLWPTFDEITFRGHLASQGGWLSTRSRFHFVGIDWPIGERSLLRADSGMWLRALCGLSMDCLVER